MKRTLFTIKKSMNPTNQWRYHQITILYYLIEKCYTSLKWEQNVFRFSAKKSRFCCTGYLLVKLKKSNLSRFLHYIPPFSSEKKWIIANLHWSEFFLRRTVERCGNFNSSIFLSEVKAIEHLLNNYNTCSCFIENK